ncbi:50S ribosomal protein L7/L12, partial [Leptospira meyeri]
MSVDALLEQIGSLTLVQAADLVKKMEDKFGISAAAPVAV